MQPILVTGSHRSGSTWVGRVLVRAPGVGYVNEPFNPLHRPGTCSARFEHWFQYVTEENEGPYREALARTLRFEYDLGAEFGSLRTARDAARLFRDWARLTGHRLRRRRAVVKDPIALLSAPWLASRFDMQVIVLIRHPAAFASSLKRLDWTFDFGNLLRQPLLLKDAAVGYVDEMARLARDPGDIIDQAALLWRVLYDVVSRYRVDHPGWLYLRHEDLSRRPFEEFGAVFRRVGLSFTDSTRRYIEETTHARNPAEVASGRKHLLERNSRANIFSWKRRLTLAEVDRLRKGVEDVASRFYGDDEW